MRSILDQSQCCWCCWPVVDVQQLIHQCCYTIEKPHEVVTNANVLSPRSNWPNKRKHALKRKEIHQEINGWRLAIGTTAHLTRFEKQRLQIHYSIAIKQTTIVSQIHYRYNSPNTVHNTPNTVQKYIYQSTEYSSCDSDRLQIRNMEEGEVREKVVEEVWRWKVVRARRSSWVESWYSGEIEACIVHRDKILNYTTYYLNGPRGLTGHPSPLPENCVSCSEKNVWKKKP